MAKTKLNFFIENPNTAKEVIELLKQIVIAKLMAADLSTPPKVDGAE